MYLFETIITISITFFYFAFFLCLCNATQHPDQYMRKTSFVAIFPKRNNQCCKTMGTPHLFGTFPRTGTDLVVSSHMFKVAPRLHYQKAQNNPCHTFYSLVGVRTSVHVAQQTPYSISLFLTGNQRITIVESPPDGGYLSKILHSKNRVFSKLSL